VQLSGTKAKRQAFGVGNWFRKGDLSVGTRLAACFVAIMALIVMSYAVAFWQFRQMERSGERVRKADEALRAVVRVHTDIGSFRDRVGVMANSQNVGEFAKDTLSLKARFLEDVSRAQALVIATPELNQDGITSSALETLKTTLPAQLDTVAELADAGDWTAVRLRLAHQIQDLRELSLSQVGRLDQQVAQAQSAALEATTRARRNLLIAVPIAALVTLFAAAVLGWYLKRSITAPLSELAAGARSLAQGNFHHQVNVRGNDELAILGRTFNQAARQLQELYAELREQANLLSLTHDSIYVRDMSGVIRYWNHGAEALYGWAAEQAVGEPAHQLLGTAFPEPLEQIEAELLRTGRWEGELSQKKKDGSQVLVATRWSLKRDDQGSPVAVLVTSNDITRRRRAEEELRESETRFRTFVDHAGDALFVYDLEQRTIVDVNKKACESLGYTRQEIIGKTPLAFHPDSYKSEMTSVAERAIEGQTVFDTHWHRRKDGTEFPVEVHTTRVSYGGRQFLLMVARDISDRLRAEEAVRQSEKQLREVIETMPAMAFSARTDGFVEFVNRRYLEYTNLTPDSASGSSWQTTVHPDDLERTTRKWLEALATGEPLENELRHRSPKGEYRWFSVRATPLRDEHGSILRWYGLLFDIEDRKRAEEALHESETRFRTFVDHAGDAFFVYDLEQKTIVDVNREACRSLGYAAEEIIGKAPGIFHPDSYEAHIESLAERAASGDTVFDTHWHRRKDGTMFPVEVHTSRVLYGGRQFLLMVARDISDRLRAEEAVRQSEKQLREVIETIPAIAWTTNSDGALEFVNKRWQDYTAMSPAEAVGLGWKSAFHPQDIERYLERRRTSLASGALFEDEVRIRSGGGEYRWFLSRAVPLRDEQGNILRWYGTATDIHDRKQVEQRLHVENVVLREEIDKASMFEEVVGASPALRRVLSAVSKVAPTDSTVLLTGETGTGKELIARAIHRKSERSGRVFISVNCAAIPQSLIASELFGHEKGAFTGALQRHLGKFELAEGGTIFLDELGELPMETQVALLRVLQEREIQRVGGSQSIRVNVRVLAATNRDLQKAIGAGTLREDLFYRLNVFPIHVPPLRERKEDIPMLVEYFIDRFARKAGKNIVSIDKQSLDLLESYSWPGNIRELQNVVERSVVLCDTDTLTIDGSWLAVRNSAPSEVARSLASQVHEQERELIERALAEAGGKVSGPLGAATRLGISPSALEYKIRLLKINKHQFKKYFHES
jgi:PAS domain S-box-containing protein